MTRPEPGASETARRLEALGFLPLKLPLHRIEPLSVDLDAAPAAAAVAVTSSNAIRLAPGELLARLSNLPCFAVGEATADAARTAGFMNVVEGGGDADSLVETIVAHRPNGPVAYLCGKVRRPVFERRLAEERVFVHAVETYDTVGLSYTVKEVTDLTVRHPVDYVLVHSANAAEMLTLTIRQHELEGLFENAIFACISGRVAEALGGRPRNRIRIASTPDETTLLSLLGPRQGDAS